MFWYFAIALLALAALFVVVPTWRFHRDSADDRSRREQANLLIFKERVAELERELEAGLLESENFDALKAELERSLLSDVTQQGESSSSQNSSEAGVKKSRLVPIIMFLLAIPVSVLFYQQWGFSDELELAELFERTSTNQDPEVARELVYSIGEILEHDPENGWALYFLGQNLITLGEFPLASSAFERASQFIEQPQDQAVVLGQHAFLEYMLAGQEITEKVEEVIDRIQRLEPNQVLALQILGMDAEKQQDYQSAITYWRRVLQLTPQGDDANAIRERISIAQQALATSSNSRDRDAAAGPRIDVELSIAEGIDLPADTRVFVSALEEGGRGQPLAAQVLTLGELPTTIRLTNADAVGPFNLSSAEMVYVVATASSTGTANVSSGDYQTRTEAFAHLNTHAILQLEIKDLVP
ncbi:MAG: c-type cytochrome biogenesis protein CcmI [Pseudohongiellaceae bacterium]|nr:c-type cytochrome biogenesis protein CcmI [Pseudohongiellaceae bacterium]